MRKYLEFVTMFKQVPNRPGIALMMFLAASLLLNFGALYANAASNLIALETLALQYGDSTGLFEPTSSSVSYCLFDWAGVGLSRLCGTALILTGRPNDAIWYLIKATIMQPTDLMSRFWLGQAYIIIGERGKAIRELRAAGAAPYFINKGTVALERGDLADAEASYLLALEIAPGAYSLIGSSLHDAYHGLAKVYRSQHRWDEAIAALEQAISLTPTDPNLYVELGQVWAFGKRDADAAIAAYKRGIEAYPAGHVWLSLGVGEVYLNQGDFAEARWWILDAQRVDPTSGAPHWFLGLLALRQNRFAEAIDHYQEAIRRGVESTPVLYGLGAAYLGSGQAENALPFLLKAIEREPSYVDALLALGDAYAVMDLTNEARDAYQRALALRPDDLELQQKLSSLP